MAQTMIGDLVLGAAVGYTEAQIAPFLRSLRAAGHRGEVILLVDPRQAPGMRASPLFRGVTLVETRQWPPVRYSLLRPGRRWIMRWLWRPLAAVLWLAVRGLARAPAGRGRDSLLLALATLALPPTESRFPRYLEILRSRPDARVLLTDVRDVIFQSDPFAALPPCGLAVSMEPLHLTIGTEPHNARWVELVAGRAMLERLRDRPVSCSGLTYGDGRSIQRYLEAMVHGLHHVPLRAVGQSGIDQGIHNVLIGTGSLGDVLPLETLNGPVATIGTLKEEQLRADPQGRLLNADGTIVSIVHQYDRHPGLRRRLLERLP